MVRPPRAKVRERPGGLKGRDAMNHLTRRDILFGAAAASATAALAPITSVPARAAAPLAGKQAPSFYRFKLGDYEITVLSDGARTAPIPDGYVKNTSKD